VAAPGIGSVADLKGKKIGLEEGFVGHLLFLTAAERAGLADGDYEIVNTPTDETPQVLKAGAVQAVAAWQPNSGQALKAVEGSKPVFTSADAPGIIYDLLYVDPASLEKRRADWAKVAKVWYRIVAFLQDPANTDEALAILSARVGITPAEYEPFFKGTYILSLDEALERWAEAEGLGSVYGSTDYVDAFNVAKGVYEKRQGTATYLDPSLTKEYAESMK
jgi:NitT/TauT family transport system substrate-binding protein